MKHSKKGFKKFGLHWYSVPMALQSDMFEVQGNGLTWEKWEEEIKKICPIQFWFRNDFVHFFSFRLYCLRHWYWDTKAKLFHPYNVIKIDTLKPTYTDEREQLLHVNFQILSNFLNNKPEQKVNYQYHPGTYSHPKEEEIAKEWSEWWKEANLLNDWWKNYNKRYEEINKESDKAMSSNDIQLSLEIEKKWQEEIESMLIRLIKCRKGLWC